MSIHFCFIFNSFANTFAPVMEAKRLLTTWRDIETELFPILASLSQPQVFQHAASADLFRPLWVYSIRQNLSHSPVHVSSKTNPDSTLNTLKYLFFHLRCGILVCVRNNSVCVFQPFANVHYKNNWGSRVVFPEGANKLEYQTKKTEATHIRSETWLPTDQWWLNGGIVCNVMPSSIWGESHIVELLDMLTATCKTTCVPDCDFFINKRDYPQLRRDFKEPYGRFIGEMPLCREVYSAYTPVLSFYGGTDFADCTMPLTEDWKRAKDASSPDDLESLDTMETEWAATAKMAVWRGTATGNGLTASTNQRLRLVSLQSDRIDAELTGFNLRDKICVDPSGQLMVDFLKTKLSRGPFMSLQEQTAKFRYVVYVDGHCAANRYTALMQSYRTILRVDSERLRDGGHMWSLFDLVPAVVYVDGTVILPETSDHFQIYSDFSNLECTIDYLRENDAIAKEVALRAYSKCPTKQDIVKAWAALLHAVHTYTTHVPTLDELHHAPLYSPFESKYARLSSEETGLFSSKT